MHGQATTHCLYNSPAYDEELWEGGREGERERRETANRLGEVEEGKWKKDWWEGKGNKM